MAPRVGEGNGRASPRRGMLQQQINRASVEEGFPLPCLPWSHRRSPLQLGICELRNGFFSRTVSAVLVSGRGFGWGGFCRSRHRWCGGAGGEGHRCASGSPQFALDKWVGGRCGALAGGRALRGLSLKISCLWGRAPETAEIGSDSLLDWPAGYGDKSRCWLRSAC